MTNEQIIFNASMELMKQGVIGSTGREFSFVDDNGETVTVKEPEPLHTFAGWKSRGFSVKKGEHATATIDIWKQGKPRTVKNEDGTEEEKPAKMFMKRAFFFTASQVEPLKVATA